MALLHAEKLHDYSGHKECIYRIEKGDHPYEFFTAAGEGWVVKWDLREEDAPGKVVAQLPGSIFSLHNIPGMRKILAGHRVGGIHLLDLEEKEEKRNLQQPATVFDMKSMPEHNLLIVGLAGGQLAFYELESLKEITRLKAGEDHARNIAVHPDGDKFTVGFSDNHIRTFNAETLKILHAFQAHDNSVFTVAYDHTGKWLVSGGRDAHLKIWEVTESGPELYLSIPAHMLTLNYLDFSPCGKYLATGSRDKTIKIWDTSTWKLLKVLDRLKVGGHQHSVNTLLWTDYEDQLISAGDDKIVKTWSLQPTASK